ncbi:MAG: maleylacetoacetate isomerase [Betaproteobacteria bacterium]|nr:maleylacetoacetate isomerase [Betaproteobacteria bacterium]
MLRLYNYFRSSASFRVRIALELKGLPYEYVPLHLVRAGGAQLSPEFTALNPQQLVPALEADGQVLTQSLAIIEWLDETHPAPPLLPADPWARAHARALAQAIACEIHPLNNLRVLRYLVRDLKVSEDDKDAWYRHWVETGMAAVEQALHRSAYTGTYCMGDAPGLADCVLVPQVFNARRMNCRIDHLAHVQRITANCMQLAAFDRAQPSRQPDNEG